MQPIVILERVTLRPIPLRAPPVGGSTTTLTPPNTASWANEPSCGGSNSVSSTFAVGQGLKRTISFLDSSENSDTPLSAYHDKLAGRELLLLETACEKILSITVPGRFRFQLKKNQRCPAFAASFTSAWKLALKREYHSVRVEEVRLPAGAAYVVLPNDPLGSHKDPPSSRKEPPSPRGNPHPEFFRGYLVACYVGHGGEIWGYASFSTGKAFLPHDAGVTLLSASPFVAAAYISRRVRPHFMTFSAVATLSYGMSYDLVLQGNPLHHSLWPGWLFAGVSSVC